jgi:hypothetical protein
MQEGERADDALHDADARLMPHDAQCDDVDAEHEGVEQHGTLRDGPEAEKRERGEHRAATQRERGARREEIIGIPLLRPPGEEREQRREAEKHAYRHPGGRTDGVLRHAEELRHPARLHEDRARSRERGEMEPAFVFGNSEHADVEQGDETEEAERLVTAGGAEDRRQKTAQHAEHGHHLRIEPHREQKRRAVMSVMSRKATSG